MGRRIREDYEGVAMATGQMGAVLLRGGDEIPEGVSVDGFLTDDGQPVRAPEDPSPFSGAGTGEAGAFDEAPLREDELHLALAKGADVARHPAYVRGYLDAVAEHTEPVGGPPALEATDLPPAPEPDPLSDFLNAAYDQLQASGAQHAELWLPDGSLIVFDAASEPPVQAVQAPPTGPPSATSTPPASAFDPSQHNAHDVITYLGEHEEDRVRVLAAERAGQARRSVLNRYPGLDPTRHPELAQAYDDAASATSTSTSEG